ncbi:hypothetical protein GNZ13_01730 [Paraburkholderia sp. 5N]|uniref:Uncharacterized protein n=2 Tax=Paraburkholderia elongata TaxID=2675747 RepID=A0A972SG09_9BURK|nr:hypothetical protein [Paraburkholderia elongata]
MQGLTLEERDIPLYSGLSMGDTFLPLSHRPAMTAGVSLSAQTPFEWAKPAVGRTDVVQYAYNRHKYLALMHIAETAMMRIGFIELLPDY